MTKTTAQPQCSVIIVNYNGRSWLEKCLRSFALLNDEDRARLEVIVVDNASTDDSHAVTTKHFPWVKWIQLNENVGFSAGNNAGIQRARGEFIFLLNSDAEFLPNTSFAPLLQRFTQNQHLAVLTPKIVLDSGELDHACHRGFPTPWNALMYFSGLARLFPHWRITSGYLRSWESLETPHAIEACSGAAMMVRRSAINEVGLLDESYFMYAEDIDWCFRFVRAGWQVWFDPSMVVLHHKYKSGQGTAEWETRQRTISAFFDTMKQFFRKFYSDRYPHWVLLGFFLVIDTMKRRKLRQERMKYVS